MQQNSIPILRELSITNHGNEPVTNVEIAVDSSPVFFTSCVWRVSQLSPGQRYRIPNLDLEMDAGTLARLSEAEKGSVRFILRKDGDELVSHICPVELLARSEWGGIGCFPELAAAFVQPNDPAVQHILGKTIDILKSHGKEPSLVGYGRGKRGSWEQVSALWNAISGQQIGYALPPASFEQTGQKVRHPSLVLEAGIGTCLDLAMLFASCIEQCGLNPILAFIEGHAFVGCWLSDETFTTAVVDDVTALRKRLHLQELLVFETTLAAQQKAGACSFKWACERGEEHISEGKEQSFQLAIDVRRARIQRILPLAMAQGAGAEKPTEDRTLRSFVPAFDEAPDFMIDATPEDRFEANRPLPRLDRWQRRLLDLSLRNNLLNFRAGKRAIELIGPEPGLLEDRLSEGYRFRIMPSIEQQGADPREYTLHAERHQEDLISSHAMDALKRNELLAPLPRQELEARLLELFRTARNALEEGGANTLFLVFGFLSWKPKDRDKSCKAPLVLIPVKLERKSVQSGFSLSLHDDEPRFNLTLLEMLRKDFAISALDGFERELPKDSQGLDIDSIWRTVQRAVKDIPGWEVTSNISIALFSFAKYLMWKDLVDRTEVLKVNPIVRHLLDTPSDRYREGGSFLGPKDLDNRLSPQDVYCPLPVDSSQLSAVASAAQGKDFVLIGPPGTGKSQTIANMIAQCLAQRQTVLFVAEKTAALNVVYRRLKAIGLGEFCLELHSQKARKVEVLEQLRKAYDLGEDFVENRWDLETKRLDEFQKRLNGYVESLHRSYPNGLTPFKAMGILLNRPDLPFVRFSWSSPGFHNQAAMARMRDIVARIRLQGSTSKSMESTALREVRRSDWSPAWADELTDAARELATSCSELERAAADLFKVSGIPILPLDSRGREGLERLARILPKAHGKDWRFVLRPDAAGLFLDIRDGARLIVQHKEIQKRLSVVYRPEALQLDHPMLLSIWELASETWVQRLQDAINLFREYVAHSRKLSVPFKAEAYRLDLSALRVEWEQSKESWWLRRSASQNRIRKILMSVVKDGVQAIPDIEGDLAILASMKELQDRFEHIEPLGKEATLLLIGTPTIPAPKSGAFRAALRQAISPLRNLEDSPVGILDVVKRLLGVGISLPASQNDTAMEFDHGTDIAAFLKANVSKKLQDAAQPGSNAVPDCLKDLPCLAAMRSFLDRITRLDESKEKTGGVWCGLSTNTQEIELAASFHESLQTATGQFADRPDTLLSLHNALGYLLGPGNVLLGSQSGAGMAMDTYLNALENFRARLDILSNLADAVAAEWPNGDPSSISGICSEIVAQQSNLHDWCAWLRLKEEAQREGIAPLVEAMIAGVVEPENISEAFEFNYSRWWLSAAVEDLRVLRSFVAVEHEQTQKDFQDLVIRLRELSGQCIRMRIHSDNCVEDNVGVNEWGVLKRQFEKKRRHMPVRQLIASIPTVLMRLTPCLLMSPLSIAQYLAPNTMLFDLVIFDEASQIPPWDAIGAMARGKRVVVVGDPKQLPPTNFFTRSEDEDASDEVTQEADMESILVECLGSSVPDIKLRWHYRSRHESLITFSNHRYYEGELVTFPAPQSEDHAVSCTHVSGIYQRGGTRTNPIEARAVVEEIISRLNDPAFIAQELTIGVVTFNAEQQRLIEDLFEVERRKDRSLDRIFGDELAEPLFVKNLESVQGDERDIIYFSTTYGPDQTGRVSMNFGPLNQDGGERRLNVAVTRARHELRVFTSLLQDQIDITRTNALGVRDLKLFLGFANRGARVFFEENQGSVGDYESPFEEAVARTLRQKGWQVHPQIGVSAFRIDLGIVDPDVPGRYLAGVECDGATYHRAATARDRDKLREKVLRELGWKILRVWSTEWWTSHKRAATRLHEQLAEILEVERENRAKEEENLQQRRVIIEEVASIPAEPEPERMADVNEEHPNQAEDEQTATSETPDAMAEQRMLEVILEIVHKESPIHQDVLAQRVARKMGFYKAGRRIREAVWKMAKSHFHTTDEDVGEFYWKTSSEADNCASCRPGTEGEPRSVDQVAMPELLALARSIPSKAGEEPVILMARHLGLRRLRSSSRPRLEAAWAESARSRQYPSARNRLDKVDEP